MAAIDLSAAARPGGRARKRIGFRLDMTPLVDVAFLLLTFFMFATTMSQPQAMEIRIPRTPEPVEVDASTMLTLLVRSDGVLFYRLGTAAPVRTTPAGIEALATAEIRRLGNSQLTTLRADEHAAYGTVVAVLDRLDIVERTMEEELAARGEARQRRFTIAAMGRDDRKAIEDAR